MEYKIGSVRLLLAIVIVNAIGFALKYFELDTFIILLGFRFHLSAVLPLLVVIKREHLSLIKDSFLHPHFVHIGRVILIFIFTTLLFLAALFFTNEIEVGDPEYFYEFGLSSVADYPVYLLWNSIQLIMLYLFLSIIKENFKGNFFLLLIIPIVLFLYEFIPVKKIILDYESIAAFFLICLIVAVIIKFFNNVYLFVTLIFSIIWFSILAFGSMSYSLINLLFAANYNSWEGFFTVDKSISYFIISSNYLLILLSLFIILLVNKRKPS